MLTKKVCQRELIRSKRKVEWGGLVVGQGEEAEPGVVV